ncbi:MAG: SCP2 sterol-binding domain-containing protein [Lachnospiraceae bacterium]|nr:SCP2 sterol-binding domain-containing protein [Lachnospiraceae bacterium]
MKINIYYGGRGLLEDPSLYVMDKLTGVLDEVRVHVERYNIYENKSAIAMMVNTLKEADGVILVASVEWFGIGGLLQQFLDACWLYADRNIIGKIYMFPVVISTTGGEREAQCMITRAWELLGGKVCDGICAYVDDQTEFETDPQILSLIEKKGEDIYRIVHQGAPLFKCGARTGAGSFSKAPAAGLTPQESEQLSEYVSNDTFVQKQKKDVELLSQKYRNILDTGKDESRQEFIKEIKDSFVKSGETIEAVFSIEMTDTNRTLVIEIRNDDLKVYYGEASAPDVEAKTTRDVVNKIVRGRQTVQGAFMSGVLSSKGDFKLLRSFDQFFRFSPVI